MLAAQALRDNELKDEVASSYNIREGDRLCGMNVRYVQYKATLPPLKEKLVTTQIETVKDQANKITWFNR
jgi:hypothetical protein